jgi:protein-disulfide isomerase
MKRLLTAALLLSLPVLCLQGQTTAPANDPHAKDVGYPFRNMGTLKPQAGAKVAVVEFEDMECPKCAHDFPFVRETVARRKVAFERHDFPLTEIHQWSFEAAVTARYIQNTFSAALAEQFRRDVFANQQRIQNKDDLTRYTQGWFASHQRSMPFVLDASGDCRAQVRSDRAFGDSLGIHGTDCLFVVTQKRWVLVTDVTQLDRTLDVAEAETAVNSVAPRRAVKAKHAGA